MPEFPRMQSLSAPLYWASCLFFGLGADIKLINQVGLCIEAERYELDDDEFTSVGGSLLYRF